MEEYTYLKDFADTSVIPKEGILSKTLLDTPAMKLVLFHFAQGEELSEHTASMPAVIQLVHGDMRLTLGDDAHEVEAGAFVYMPAHLKHAVYAKTPLIMLLQLVKMSPE
jgi:quercetin dioxygenase-like cupin family protein